MAKQRFVYVEDQQGCGVVHVLMEQDSEADLDTGALTELSKSPPGAGRISTGADTLIELARDEWLKLREIERRPMFQAMPDEWSELPVVTGATGNY